MIVYPRIVSAEHLTLVQVGEISVQDIGVQIRRYSQFGSLASPPQSKLALRAQIYHSADDVEAMVAVTGSQSQRELSTCTLDMIRTCSVIIIDTAFG
jgi:hypothetical protein